MASIAGSILEKGCADLASQIFSRPLPLLKVRINVQEEQRNFLAKIPQEIFSRMKSSFPNSFCFLENKQVVQTRYLPLKDSPEKRLISLASVYFASRSREEELFEYLDQIPGIDIMDRKDRNVPNKCCDWFVFKNEPWFTAFRHSNLHFSPMAVEFLEKLGYQRIVKPEVGAIIIYFHSPNADAGHAGRAAHYGKIVEIDASGAPIIESKFVQFSVYRHKQELVPCFFGSEVVYMKKKP